MIAARPRTCCDGQKRRAGGDLLHDEDDKDTKADAKADAKKTKGRKTKLEDDEGDSAEENGDIDVMAIDRKGHGRGEGNGDAGFQEEFHERETFLPLAAKAAWPALPPALLLLPPMPPRELERERERECEPEPEPKRRRPQELTRFRQSQPAQGVRGADVAVPGAALAAHRMGA